MLANKGIVPLVDATDPMIWGGKAANLAKMIRSKEVPVPEGFVISPEGLRDWSAIPPVRRRQIEKWVRSFSPGTEFVARSSAACEDGKEHSFAGQFTSRLNLTGGWGTVFDEACNVSFELPPRVREYMRKNNITEKPRVAVIVQKQVEAYNSAVVFTRNPTTGGNEFVLEVIEGLGEGLVSGRETPGTFTYREGAAPTFVAGHELKIPDWKSLILLGMSCERILRCPVDVEAAWDDSQWWAVQARPITTLEVKDGD